jgi:hypothetical protein
MDEQSSFAEVRDAVIETGAVYNTVNLDVCREEHKATY